MSNDPFTNAGQQLAQVGEILKLDAKILARLAKPDAVHETELEIKMDDGQNKKFKAYRSQHNMAKGPYKGGIRFHPNVSLSEVKALSMWMTWKCAVAGLPYGGGKGGIVVDPKSLSQAELERLSRAYGEWLAEFVGPWLDVPAPDVNTNGEIMAYMLDALIKTKSLKERMSVAWQATFTGKPIALGGSLGREEATGMGGFYTLENLVASRGWKKSEVSVAVQGMGNVGYWFAKLASEAGYKVVAISDSSGGVYEANGLPIDEVVAYKKATGSLSGYKNAKSLTNAKLLELPVSVLVPAALENVIGGENASKIQAKAIIEMANGPVTPEADLILADRQIFSVPDVLANAGGVTVSYFEWVQNLSGYYWEKEEVFSKLKIIMDRAYLEMSTMWEERIKDLPIEKRSLRMAVYATAVERVVAAMV